MGRGGAVGRHDLGLPDDPASRWLLHMADKDKGSKRRADILRVGLYYSILSLRDDIRHFNITPAKVKLIRDQLTELLTGYGEVDILITDGWDAPWSRITYEEVPFQEIYEHIKNLQPNCLLCDLNASQYPSGGLYYSDVKAFEQNAGQKVPEDSDVPALSCVTLTDGWFWKQQDVNGHLKAVTTVVDSRYNQVSIHRCSDVVYRTTHQHRVGLCAQKDGIILNAIFG
jgi:alpha-L-fucosidase